MTKIMEQTINGKVIMKIIPQGCPLKKETCALCDYHRGTFITNDDERLMAEITCACPLPLKVGPGRQ